MKLDFVRPYLKYLPEVSPPARPLTLEEKLKYTGGVLIIFFVLYHLLPVGVSHATGEFEFVTMIMASKIGSLLTAGIGPIVLASIFLQLFAGAKIIDINLQDPNDKILFSGSQKYLAIILAFFEATMYTRGSVPVYGILGSAYPPLFGSLPLTMLLVMLQIAFSSIILMYLDEIVTKYGIGSGVSLFIAGGVALAIIQGTIVSLIPGAIYQLNLGGANALANAILALLPLAFTLVVFALSAYAEGVFVAIPIVFERIRGYGSSFPIKFLYVSNIPVILGSALLMSLRTWVTLANIGSWNIGIKIGNYDLLRYLVTTSADGKEIVDGLIYFILPSFSNPVLLGAGENNIFNPVSGYSKYIALLMGQTPVFGIPQWIHVIVYAVIFIGFCTLFGKFWIETAGMAPRDIANQLKEAGLSQPGFRRDPRIVEKQFAKYIYTITILGSMFVAFLAVFADLTGALGTGTGVLLTVGIVYRFYEDLTNQQLFDLYPQVKRILG